MTEHPSNIHDMNPDAFLRKVQSFQFWFESVEGYLHGLEYGRGATLPEPAMDEAARDRLVTVLCNYCVGESAALEGAGALIQIAPNSNSQVFLSTQAVDEGRHLEVLRHRLEELLGVDPTTEIERRANRGLLAFKARLLDTIRAGDWTAAIFAQNVVLESMEFAVFHAHADRADARTGEVLRGIIKDERRHIGFGEGQLGRLLKVDPVARDHIKTIRRTLDPMVLGVFEESMSDLGMSRQERIDLGRGYLGAVERLGLV